MMGEYNIVIVVDAPNDEAVAKVSLMLRAKESVLTHSVLASTEAEYLKIIPSLL